MPLHVCALKPYERLKPEFDRMNEECGVFGIYSNTSGIDAAEAAYYGLFSLQHRGQESAGIAVSRKGKIECHKEMGLVSHVYPAEELMDKAMELAQAIAANAQVAVHTAWKTPQFWLLWVVLCMNVSAGIGILGRASDMLQDMFHLTGEEGAAIGGGFVGLISLFNMGGRFLWSSASDLTGRKTVYCIYFILGAILYSLLPMAQEAQSRLVFVLIACVIISMYGGGFATIPAYLKDTFGTYQVGAIHGRLITAWSAAAVIGPLLINKLSDAAKAAGVPKDQAYNGTLRLMCLLLAVGLVANLLMKPVAEKYHLKLYAEDKK